MRLVVVALVCSLSTAYAEEDSPEKQQARLLLAQGNALFEKGDLKAALADFRAAYALYPSPKLLVNCAAAERELGDFAAAANDLRRYLDEVKAEDEPPFADRAMADLQALEKKVGRVQLAGWPPRTVVEVNGRAARDPAYVRASERHRVKVRAPGGEAIEHEVELGAGQHIEIPMPVQIAGPLDKRPPKKKSRGWIAAVVVGSVLVAGGAIALGVVLGTQQSSTQLTGDLGTYRFTEFH